MEQVSTSEQMKMKRAAAVKTDLERFPVRLQQRRGGRLGGTKLHLRKGISPEILCQLQNEALEARNNPEILERRRLKHEAELDELAGLPGDQEAKADLPSWLRQYQRDAYRAAPKRSTQRPRKGRRPKAHSAENDHQDEFDETHAEDAQGSNWRRLQLRVLLREVTRAAIDSKYSDYRIERTVLPHAIVSRSSIDSPVEKRPSLIQRLRRSASYIGSIWQAAAKRFGNKDHSASLECLPKSPDHLKASHWLQEDARLASQERKRLYMQIAATLDEEKHQKKIGEEIAALEDRLMTQQEQSLELRHSQDMISQKLEAVKKSVPASRRTVDTPTRRIQKRLTMPPLLGLGLDDVAPPGAEGNSELSDLRWLCNHRRLLEHGAFLEDDRAMLCDNSDMLNLLGGTELTSWQECELWRVRQNGRIPTVGESFEATPLPQGETRAEAANATSRKWKSSFTKKSLRDMARPQAWGAVDMADSEYGADWFAESLIEPSTSKITRAPACFHCGRTSFLAEICSLLPAQGSKPVCITCSQRYFQSDFFLDS